jgi:hypothetical protein
MVLGQFCILGNLRVKPNIGLVAARTAVSKQIMLVVRGSGDDSIPGVIIQISHASFSIYSYT